MKHILLALSLYSVLASAHSLNHQGYFSEISSSTIECDFLLAKAEYQSRLFLFGPSKLQVIIHFTNLDTGEGFLNEKSFVGNVGYQNDFLASKQGTIDGYSYRAVAEGYFDWEFTLADLTVELMDPVSEEILCTAQGRYTGF